MNTAGSKIVYYARSIRGERDSEADVINRAIWTAIRTEGMIPAIDLPVTVLKSFAGTSDQYIYARDLDWLNLSQLFIAEVSNASTGVGVEFAYAAWRLNLPILAVARKDASVSAMITGGFGVLRYESVEEVVSLVSIWLKQWKERAF
jgi:hypothetical protein